MRHVPITVYVDDKLEPETAGWGLGLWGRDSKSIKKEDIWGLTIDGWPTQMCYGIDYAEPLAALLKRKKKFEEDGDTTWLYWYFDVGRKLRVSISDLQSAFKMLGYHEPTEEV